MKNKLNKVIKISESEKKEIFKKIINEHLKWFDPNSVKPVDFIAIANSLSKTETKEIKEFIFNSRNILEKELQLINNIDNFLYCFFNFEFENKLSSSWDEAFEELLNMREIWFYKSEDFKKNINIILSDYNLISSSSQEILDDILNQLKI